MSSLSAGNVQEVNVWYKESPYNAVWLAATTKKRLTRKECVNSNVFKTCNQLQAETRIALQLASCLLLGLTRIHSKQTVFLKQDCQALINMFLGLVGSRMTARLGEITLPKQNFNNDFSFLQDSTFFGTSFDAAHLMGEEFFHYSFSEDPNLSTSLVPGSLPTTPKPLYLADEKDITLPDHQIVPEISFLDQLVEDQYFGDESVNFANPSDAATVSSPSHSPVGPDDTSHDQVLLLDSDHDDGLNFKGRPISPTHFDNSGAIGGWNSAPNSCVPQLGSSSLSFNLELDLSNCTSIQHPADSITAEARGSTFLLAPLGEADGEVLCSRFAQKRAKKQVTVTDMQTYLAGTELDEDEIKRYRNYKTRPVCKYTMVRKNNAKSIMSLNATCISQDGQSTMSAFMNKMFLDLNLSEPLPSAALSESPLLHAAHTRHTELSNTLNMMDDSTRPSEVEDTLDSVIERQRRNEHPLLFQEQSDQASGLIVGASHLSADSIKSSSSLRRLNIRSLDRPALDNVDPTRGLTPIMDVGSELEGNYSMGVGEFNEHFDDSSIELPRCDPFGIPSSALEESTVGLFSKHLDGILNQQESLEFKDLLPGNRVCKKMAAKTFSKMLGVLSSSNRYKVQQDTPYGSILITRDSVC